jgi:ADP-ribose pyrophosphatase YjhB (NUDIX family)
MKQKLPLKEFKEIYSKVPRLCVDLVVVTKDGILLTKRSEDLSYAGFWHVPGGGVLYGENIEDALKRVAKLELGVKIKIVKLLCYLEFPSEKTLGFGQSISLDFLVEIKGQIKLNNEATEFGYYKKPPIKIVPEHKKLFELLKA